MDLNTFGAACAEQNTVEELRAALAGPADQTDCEEWGITPEQWRAEIEAAIAELEEEA